MYNETIRQSILKSRSLSKEALSDLQLMRLNKLLKHACSTVPYYTNLFKSNIELTSIAELKSLPILTKAIIQSNKDIMVTSASPKSTWIKKATGGSTGEPLELFRDAEAGQWLLAAEDRARSNMYYHRGDKIAYIWGTDRDARQLMPYEKWLNVFHCTENEIAQFVYMLYDWRPRNIRGYATSLHLVAKLIKERELPKIKPLSIESSAETLTDIMRADIEEAFGGEVFNFYGSREMSCIACEDGYHNGLLINDDLRIVEILSTPGSNIGKIIITDLINYAMPFIRYEIGDMGCLAKDSNALGQPAFSRLQQVVGRTASTITAADGALIHGEFFTHLFNHVAGIKTFQVKQAADLSITVSVVPDNKNIDDSMKNIINSIKAHLGESIKVDWQAVQEIPRTNTNKQLFTLSEVHIRFS